MYKNQSNIEIIGRVYNVKKIKKGISFLLDNESREETKVYKCLFFSENDLKDLELVQAEVFSKSDIYYVKKLKVLEDYFLNDNQEKKISELFVCTKMSSFSSIINLEYLFISLKNNNYKYIGITDNNNVCNWNQVEKLGKKYGIQPIFGVNLNFFDDEESIFKNLVDSKKKIKNMNFIVLDIESNGLDFKNIITEIGWVELKDNNISNSFSSLIYTESTLDHTVKQITGIDEKMLLSKGKKLKHILEILLKTLDKKNTILVTHNKFDIRILRYHFQKELNIDFFPNYIDSKDIFGIAFPEKKKKSLDSLSREFSLDTSNAHRAKDDATNTALLLQIAFERLDPENKKSFSELTQNLNYKYKSSFKLFAFAKNEQGKSDIYKLLSIGLTKYFFKFPRTPLSEIKKKRENIILVANCLREGELLNKYFFDYVDMEQVYNFYDYIQLLPFEVIKNNMYEKNKHNLESYLIREDGIKHFYESILEKQNKLIVSSFPNHLFVHENKLVNILSSLIFTNKYKDSKRYFRSTLQMKREFANVLKEDILFSNLDKFLEKINYEKQSNFGTELNLPNANKLLLDKLKQKVEEKYGFFHKEIKERLDHELNIIFQNKFSDIYYLVSLLIQNLKDKYNIIIGSRGSIGSSLVAYILDTTEVNPLPAHEYCKECKYFKFNNLKCGFDKPVSFCKCGRELKVNGHDILFEIFSGFDGKKTPDIDINVPTDVHDIVHKETMNFFQKYDMEVFSCGMNTTLQNKNAYFYIKKYIEDNETELIQEEIDLYTYKIIGTRLSSSKHPGGLVILPKGRSIYEFSPIQCSDKNDKDNLVTHFDHIDLENKIFKLDILAHDDPTALGNLLKDTNVKLENIQMNLPEVLDIFSTKNNLSTAGIPEFGTPFVRKILEVCKPDSFEKIIRISGIAHGINVWTNNAEHIISKFNLSIQDVICMRDDIFDILYKITKDRNFSFHTMEFIRKGKVQKNTNEFVLIEKKILSYKDIPSWFLESIRKITYLFPRSHATAYVMMAYIMAYFKIYFPLEFYKSYLNRKIEFIEDSMIYAEKEEIENFISLNKDKAFEHKEKNIIQIYEVILEIRKCNIKIQKIDINKSLGNSFQFERSTNSLIPPISIVKGIGNVVAKNIERESKKRPFKNISDLRNRTRINSTQIKLLQKIKAVNLKEIKINDLESFLNE